MHAGKYLSVLYTCQCGNMSVVSTVTTLASVCQSYKYNLIGRYLSKLLPYLQLYVYTVYHTGIYMSVVLLIPHWQVSVLIDATLACICKHCYHIGKCPSVSLTHLRVCTTCETSQVLLAGVSGGFPAVLPFGPTYRLALLYE